MFSQACFILFTGWSALEGRSLFLELRVCFWGGGGGFEWRGSIWRGVIMEGEGSAWRKVVSMEVGLYGGGLHGGQFAWWGLPLEGVCMEGVCMEGGMHGGRYAWRSRPSPLSKYSQVALGMHPTVMNSFFHNFLERSFA